MTAGQYIDYEALAQEAMRGIIRAVLSQIAKSGLFGDHHFYIAFNTQAPGVALSKRLREKYPVEMTIVLQHRFWDLEVGEDRFEVKLTFDGIPERLAIPFKAVKVFYDPSVPYGLQFEESELAAEAARRNGAAPRDAAGAKGTGAATPERPRMVGAADGIGERRDRPRPSPLPARPEAKPEKPARTDKPALGTVATVEPPVPAMPAEDAGKPGGTDGVNAPKPAARPVLAEVKPADTTPGQDAAPGAEPAGAGAKVVDLSKFRKK